MSKAETDALEMSRCDMTGPVGTCVCEITVQRAGAFGARHTIEAPDTKAGLVTYHVVHERPRLKV